MNEHYQGELKHNALHYAIIMLNHLNTRCPHCSGKLDINLLRDDERVGIYCKKCKGDILILE